MRVRRSTFACALLSAMGMVFACSTSSSGPSSIVTLDAGTTPPLPYEASAPAPVPTQKEAGPACSPTPPPPATTVGTSCQMIGSGSYHCPSGGTEVDGFLYACSEQDGAPTRPNLTGCSDEGTELAIDGKTFLSVSLCPTASCVRMGEIDQYCGGTQIGWSCPAAGTPVPAGTCNHITNSELPTDTASEPGAIYCCG